MHEVSWRARGTVSSVSGKWTSPHPHPLWLSKDVYMEPTGDALLGLIVMLGKSSVCAQGRRVLGPCDAGQDVLHERHHPKVAVLWHRQPGGLVARVLRAGDDQTVCHML